MDREQGMILAKIRLERAEELLEESNAYYIYEKVKAYIEGLSEKNC